MTRVPNLLQRLKNFFTAEGIQVFSTMSETKAAFAERTLIFEKYSLPLLGRFWLQVYTQTTSIYRYLKF